ncbi:MAG: sulfatase-like hydrolase/transferase [Planctomycetaceae bacterium]
MNFPGRHWFVLSLICVCHVGISVRAGERPNIVFVYTDDQAAWALGLAESSHARTPNLDRLFRSGAYLVNAFTTTPVCSPSRASLMTSRYGTEIGITDWINPRTEAEHGLDPAHVTWPKLLAKAGYRNALIGKWHLGTADRFHPTRFGFHHFMGFRSGGNVPQDPTLEVAGRLRKLSGLLPDLLVDDAIAFLRRQKSVFLLALHFRAPHTRWLPVADDDWAPFKDLDPVIPNPDYPKLDVARVKRMTREYLASVASVDRNVGRLLDELQRLQLSQNTIVIFSSDHGYNMGHNGIWHKGNGHWVLTAPPPAAPNIPRNQRPNMYDHSLRVPTAVRWPGVVQPGTVITNTISNLDWFPTILEMAGIDLPRGQLIRGRSIVPLLKGQSDTWDNDFYAEYSTHHQSRTQMRMYRTPDWKLVRDLKNPTRDELFNLRNDPGESTNLIRSEQADIVAVRDRLQQRLSERMRQNGDPALATKPPSP